MRSTIERIILKWTNSDICFIFSGISIGFTWLVMWKFVQHRKSHITIDTLVTKPTLLTYTFIHSHR